MKNRHVNRATTYQGFYTFFISNADFLQHKNLAFEMLKGVKGVKLKCA